MWYFPVDIILKTLLQGLSELECYGDLVCEFRKIVDKTDFSVQFKTIVTRYMKLGYNMDILRQTACMAVDPIMVDNFAIVFNCTTVCRSSE